MFLVKDGRNVTVLEMRNVFVSICGYFFSLRFWAVFCWSGLLGAGTGLFVPAVASMLIDCFDEEERKLVAGWQTSAVNLGGVLLSLFSGILASVKWNNAYLIFLSAIPVLILCIKSLPHEDEISKKENDNSEGRLKIPSIVFICTMLTVIFGIVYFCFSTNISLLLDENGYGNASLAGVATACFMLGGGVFGFLFRKISGFLKDNTAIGAFVLLAVSFFSIYFLNGLAPLLIAAFFGGGSLSIIFPFFLVKISDHVHPNISVISTSLIVSVGPNLGSFLSPIIITKISSLCGNTSVRFRFFIAAILALMVVALLLINNFLKLEDQQTL